MPVLYNTFVNNQQIILGLFHFAIVDRIGGKCFTAHDQYWKATFNQARMNFVPLSSSIKFISTNLEQMRLKNRENLRTANLNPKFTGSYKKKSNTQWIWICKKAPIVELIYFKFASTKNSIVSVHSFENLLLKIKLTLIK